MVLFQSAPHTWNNYLTETRGGGQHSLLASPQILGHAIEAEQGLAIFGEKVPGESGLKGALQIFSQVI